jgi:hypothetical protein
MAIASALARSRGRFWLQSDALSPSLRAKRSNSSIRLLRRGLLRRFAPLRKRFAFVAGNDVDASPLLRRNIPQARRMCRNILDAVFQMHPLVRRQLLRHAHPRPPLGRGADRPRRKTAAAVRADIVQLGLNAIRAECAFIGTCIHRNISARPSHSAADPCRNIRSSAGVAAPWRPRDVNPGGSSQIGGKTRMTNFPRIEPSGE